MSNDDTKWGDGDRPLDIAFRRALAFPLSKASDLGMTPQKATEYAEQEAAFNVVAIDDDAMSSGMRLALLQPARTVMAEWRQCKGDFNTLLQPFMADIKAVETLQKEAEEEVQRKNNAIEAVERQLRQSPTYEDIDSHKQRAQARYEGFVNRYANREAVMFATKPFYWFLIFLVGVTEWFINYRAFLGFFGVPAFAAGTTVVLAVLLALSSHGHGELLKQASNRFGRDREPAKRWSDWRIFGMCTLGLFVVLGFTGAARYVYAIHLIGPAETANPLGDLAQIDVNPARDVIISLLANFGAWLVGVLISYAAHDVDPEYMAATRQYRRIRRKWDRARAHQTVELQHIEAKHAKIIEQTTTAAQTRLIGVARELDMLNQVTAHDKAIQAELAAVISANAEVYRDALARIALSRAGQIQIVRGDARTPITPFDYKAMRIAADRVMLQAEAA